MLCNALPCIRRIYTVALFWLVIEVSNYITVDVSENVDYTLDYQHFYTGAFMSGEYPAKRREKNYIIYDMRFGGLPSNTYTTMTLHSSTNLLAGMSLNMYQLVGGQSSEKILGFSTQLHTPISVFTEEGHAVQAYGRFIYHFIDTDKLYPAFLFSFKGQCCIVV